MALYLQGRIIQPQLQSKMGVCTVCSTFYPRLRTSTHCNECYNRANPTEENSTNVINALQIDGSKPVNELNVEELVSLISRTIQPVKDDLDTIKKELAQTVKAHDNRLKLLETDNAKKQERIDNLESTVVEMQKFINRIDHDERKANIIITGLSEDAIEAPPDVHGAIATLHNDTNKVKVLIKSIAGNENFDVENWQISRIGQVRQGSTRAMKVVTTSAEEREKVLPLSSKLKSLPEPWSKVYVKKDLHPVYSKENRRIRKKRFDLQTQFTNNNEQREVKIVNGQLQVDGVTVDRNLFFR